MMTDWNKSDMWLQLLFLLVLLLHQSIGTHFRGGIIMWKPTGIQNQVSVSSVAKKELFFTHFQE